MRALLAVVSASCVATAAWADDPSAAPKGPPPRFMTVGKIEPDKCLFTCHYMNEIHRIGVVHEPREMVVFLAKARIASAGGEPIATSDLWKRLKPGQTVLLAADGRNIDPAYLTIVRKDTVVIIIPQEREGPKRVLRNLYDWRPRR
jgi:hypothetical protein